MRDDGSGPSSGSRPRGLWPSLALAFGVWTVLGLFFVGQSYLEYSTNQRPFSWQRPLAYQLGQNWAWALLTPLVIFLTRRFPFEHVDRWRNGGVHLACSIALAPAQRVLSLLLFFLGMNLLGQPLELSRLLQPGIVFSGIVSGIVTYWLIAGLSVGFGYYGKYRKHQLISSKLEADLARAELKALRMQLHPHFLFNTLHTISALMEENVDLAQRMISRLSDLLRVSLDNASSQRVPLAQELDFLKMYLEIEQMRFQDRLEVDFQVAPETLDLLVPNFILQPLVENSIRHGIAPSRSRGRIDIATALENGFMTLEVRDTGSGISAPESDPSRRGLGLENTRHRLERLYGDGQRLRLFNSKSGGLIVELRIPAQPTREGPDGSE